MRVGIVGCGLIGGKRADSIARSGGELVLCHDTNEAVSKSFAEKYGIDGARDVNLLLEHDAIDVVVVATPNSFLAPLALKALQAKKHVLVEKPGAISAQEVVALTNAAKENGVRCKVGYNHRFHPAALQINKILKESGDRILWVRMAYGHGGRPGYEKEWRFQKDLSGGGELIDQGVHLLDLAGWWIGDSLSVVSSQKQSAFYKAEVEDNAFLQLTSSQGTQVQLHCSVTQWKNLFRVEVSTESHLLIWDGLGNPNYGDERLTVYTRKPEGGRPEKSEEVFTQFSSWDAEWDHFRAAIEAPTKELYSEVLESQRVFSVLQAVQSTS